MTNWLPVLTGIAGVLAAAIPAWFANRDRPSRVVADTAKIVDASGGVLTTMHALIAHLNEELDEARIDAQGARTEARAAADSAADCRRRMVRLEVRLIELGVDPASIV